MNVIFDMTLIGSGCAVPASKTGVSRVGEELFLALADRRDIDLTCSANSELAACAAYLETLANPSIRLCHAEWQRDTSHFLEFRDGIRNLRRDEKNNRSLPARATRWIHQKAAHLIRPLTSRISHGALAKCEVFHSVWNPIPDQIRRTPGIERFYTVHDLIAIKHPEYFDSNHVRSAREMVDSIHPDDWVICISEATRLDLLEFHPMDPGRIFVIPWGVSERFFQCNTPEDDARIRNKYGIPKTPYLLCLATFEPRKNLASVVDAFAKVAFTQEMQHHYLVLAGGTGWKMESIHKAFERHPAIRDRIIVTGFVEDRDLSALYSNAELFLFLSLYEGFGLPVLEAMKCGVPVISSNTSSLPEVAGEAAILHAPTDIDAVAKSILAICGNAQLRESMAARSLKHAADFTWKMTAELTADAYQHAIGAHLRTSVRHE